MTDITAAARAITMNYREARTVRTAQTNGPKQFDRARRKGKFKPEEGNSLVVNWTRDELAAMISCSFT